MFGTFKLGRCSLSEDQQSLYNAHFCTSCHALDSFGGWVAAATTNYDQTLLGLVLTALSPIPPPLASRPCTVLKFRSVSVMQLPAEYRQWLAAFNLALVAAKLDDDATDEPHLPTRLGAMALRTSIQRAWAVLEAGGFDTAGLRRLSKVQHAAERATSPTLESLSDPTAVVLADIFTYLARSTGRPELGDTLQALGHATGRFVYVWDAVRDFESDKRRHRFNALTAVYGLWDRDPVRHWLLHELRVQKQCLGRLQSERLQGIFDQLFHSMATQLRGLLQPAQGAVWGRRNRLSGQAGVCIGCESECCGCCINECCTDSLGCCVYRCGEDVCDPMCGRTKPHPEPPPSPGEDDLEEPPRAPDVRAPEERG